MHVASSAMDRQEFWRLNLRNILPVALVLIGSVTAARAEHQPSLNDVMVSARLSASELHEPVGKVLHSEGTATDAGLKGAYRDDVELASGRFAQQIDFGSYATKTTFDGKVVYRTDPSGAVHPLNGRFAKAVGVTDGWLARRAYLEVGFGGARLEALLQKVEGGHTYEVLTATPLGGQPVELWFDSATHLLAKDVRRGAISTITERLYDYRSVGGTRLPFRIVRSSDFSSNVVDVTIERYRLIGSSSAIFASPETAADFTLDGTTDVPVQIGNQVIVEGMLGGRGPYRFILDSGGHNIITPAVASELGLKPVGGAQSGGAGAGTVTQQDVMVPSVAFGNARLRNQHFYVIPLQFSTIEQGASPPLAGIIGLELFERFAVRIDYRRAKLALIPANQATAACEGTAVPITFDDDMPLVDGTVEGSAGVLAIDSGNSGSPVVQGKWAERVGLSERMKKGISTTSFGAGGASTSWVTRGGRITLGSIDIPDVDLRLSNDVKGTFSSVTEAANVGQQVLARFTALFDYAGGRICLKPVPGYVAPSLNRSGMIATKVDRSHFRVVSVAQGLNAAAVDIRPGDLIVEMGGLAADALSGSDMFNLFRQAVGTTLKLKVERGGTLLDRSVILQDPAS